jgi:hypothetical protein
MRSDTAVQRRRAEAAAIERDHGRAFPQVNAVSWAWLDLNQRPHPYQGSAPEPVSPGSRLRPGRTTYRRTPLETVANRSAPMACGPNVDRPRHAARGQRRSASRPLPAGRPCLLAPASTSPLVCHVVREALTECGTTEFWPPSPISADSSAAGLFSGGCVGRWVWDPSAVRGEMSIICVLSTAPFLVRVARCWLLCGTGRSRRGASGDRSSSSLAVAGAARRSAESTAQFRFSASWNALDTAARARDDW